MARRSTPEPLQIARHAATLARLIGDSKMTDEAPAVVGQFERTFTLTNGFSKKAENLAAAIALHYMHYHFGRPHKSLGRTTTPAMAAGIAKHVWTAEEIAALLD